MSNISLFSRTPKVKHFIQKIILFTSPFVFLLILLARQDQSFTQDLGRHLKMGEIILSCHCVPSTNLFSYVEPYHQFINHHWLSEVIFYLVYSSFGSSALLVLKVLLITIAFGIIFFLASQKSLFWASLLSVPYLFILSERFDTRPELFSFLLMGLFIFCIEQYRKHKKYPYLLLLPLLQILWVNLHIYFVIGPILVCLLIVEHIVKKKRKVDLPVLFIFLAVCLGCLLNPYGISGALQPITILQQYGYSIVENQTIFFLNTYFFNPHVLVFEILSVLFLVGMVMRRKEIGIYTFLLSLFAIYEPYMMIRNFPIFVFLTFISGVSILTSMNKQMSVLMKVTTALCVISTASVISYQSFSSPQWGFFYMRGAEKAVTFIKKEQVKGPIFNNFDIGSFLIFTLYPQEKVYVDGRPEAYSVSFFNHYKAIQEDPFLFEKEVQKYHINAIFFAHTDITPWAQIFLRSIIKNQKWIPIYTDERVIIFVRNNPENKDIITRFKKTF